MVKYWKSLARKIMESTPLQTFKTWLDTDLSNLISLHFNILSRILD